MNKTILIILLIISILTSISSVFVNKSVLDSIQFPIFYTFAINLIVFLFLNATRFIQDYPPPTHTDVRIYSTSKWIVGLFESLKDIFLNLSLKYNPVIIDQIIPMINLPILLFLYVFFLSIIRTNNTENKKSNDLAIPSFISFLVLAIGLTIYVFNNPEVKFSPGIIIEFLSILFCSISFVLRIFFVFNFHEIDTHEMNDFGRADIFALFNEIENGSIRFHRIIIFEKMFWILVFGVIFESKIYHEFWDKKFVYDEVIKNHSNLILCFILVLIFSAYNVVYRVIERCSLSSTSAIKESINGIYTTFYKFVIIIVALVVYKKYPFTTLGVVMFMIGYIFYVLFESVCCYNVVMSSLPVIINYLNSLVPGLNVTIDNINDEQIPILHMNRNENADDQEMDPNTSEQNNDIISSQEEEEDR